MNKLFTNSETKIFNGHDPIFSPSQLKIINRKTPNSQIEIIIDKNGYSYKSIKSGFVKRMLLLLTGGNYNFEIKNKEFVNKTNEVIVEARLSIYLPNGSVVFREQFGQFYLNVSNATTKEGKRYSYVSDIGNAYKAAASDALKKCAAEFGLFWDIYNQTSLPPKEQDSISYEDQKKLELLIHFLAECNNINEIEEVYNKYLETSDETEESRNILLSYKDKFKTNKS